MWKSGFSAFPTNRALVAKNDAFVQYVMQEKKNKLQKIIKITKFSIFTKIPIIPNKITKNHFLCKKFAHIK